MMIVQCALHVLPLGLNEVRKQMPKQKIKTQVIITVASLIFLLLTGCYRMPGQDEFSVVPTTNNPDVIGKSNSNWMPTTGF